MNSLQLSFLDRASTEAANATSPFPKMAACEAALESNWGNSELAKEANNLFGMKQHAHPVYTASGTLNLPTREWQPGPMGEHSTDGRWIQVEAHWVKYPDWKSCFADRLATLQRLSNAYPHYAAALNAQTVEDYIAQVSRSWSTDPERGNKCLSIYKEYLAAHPA